MADSNKLSDAELVEELAQFGEQISLPIKANRRPILVKKLNHLKARSRVKSQGATPQKGTVKPRNAKPALPPPTISQDSDSNVRQWAHSSYSGLTTRSRNLDTLSSDDSDEPIATSSVSYPRGANSRRASATGAQISSTSSSRERKREPQFADSVLRTLRRRTEELPPRKIYKREDVGASPHNSSIGNTSFRSTDTSNEEIKASPARSSLYPDLSRFTSFFSNNQNTEKTFDFESSDSDGGIDDATVSTYEVDDKSVNTSLPHMVSVHENNAHPNTSYGSRFDTSSNLSFGSMSSTPGLSTHSASRLRARKYANGHPRVQQYKSWYLESLPQLLVALAALFFAGIAVTYVVTHKDLFLSWFSSPSNMGNGDHILICKDGIPREGCYDQGEVDKALVYIEALFKDLSVRKGKVLCDIARPGDDVVQMAMFKNQVYSQALASTNAERLIECCLDHIIANPHWNLRPLRADGSLATTVNEVAKLESSQASMTLWCRLQRSLTQVLYGIAFIVAAIVCVFLSSLYLKYKLKEKEEEQREVYTMVERIIDVLQEHYEQNKREDSDEPPYLAVQHVRDQLLPPSRRRHMKPIWEKAVAFIDANESRIRLDNRLIHGEEFAVWYWLPPSSNNGKIWQGQAFGENNDNNSNQVIYSPTPCLKIRNMFDSNVESEEGWEEGVTDAVLDKCKNVGTIVHIYVDVDSREGCVYLKCTDCQTAGKVRQALHGWWFDGRLVTVKHLKTDHYHKRWPEARNATQSCKPSSNQMRSLSQPFYRSSLEMT